MSVNGVKLPPDNDPGWQAYSRLVHSHAPTPELERVRMGLRLRLGEILTVEATEHFAECDEAKIEQLKGERTSVGEEAKNILREIDSLQRKNASHTVTQPRLQANLQQAQDKLMEFRPINRTISTLDEIAANKAEHDQLKLAVNTAKAALNSNAQDIFATHPDMQDRHQRYRELQDREQAITNLIAELELPVDQRQKHSSIVWQGEGGEVFMAQVPYRA